MSDLNVMFVYDEAQWLNVGAIDAIYDSRNHDRQRVAMIRGREYHSPGTAAELVELIRKGLNPDVEFPSLDRPRFGAPGRGIPD